MIETVFGKNLMKLRKDRKLTRQAFANEMKLPVTTIAGYETAGREPKFSLLIKIADYFGVSIDSLLRGDSDDSVKLNLSNDKLTFDVPAERRGLLLAALPYAGKVINSVMSAVQETEKTRRPVKLEYNFSPTDAQNI